MKFLPFFFVFFLYGCPVQDGTEPSPQPLPNFTPSQEMQNLVSPVKDLENKELSQFYMEFADILQRDTEGLISTTGDLREVNKKAGQLAFQRTGMIEKTPGLADKLDAIFIQALGKENKELDRMRAIELFKSLAWAFE